MKFIPPSPSASTVSQEAIDLHDAFTHGYLDRRTFMERMVMLAGGAAAATALLSLIAANPAKAAMVPEGDVRLETGSLTIDTINGGLRAYLAKPKSETAPMPVVIVVHENRGLNPHIEDVARRLALAGYVAIAPDFLSPLGGTPANDPDRARDMIGQLAPDTTLLNAASAVGFAKSMAGSNGKVGAVGFCWGGGLVNRMAVAAPDLDAAVVYYGRQPDVGDVVTIRAALLFHYAGLDERIGAGKAAYEEALKNAGKPFTSHVYDGVNHAFNNDTAAARYDKAAAELAWTRTLDFLGAKLKG
ncbi:MAG: dienelactone hydrolase family protein [Rhodospirillum sp.]|nr:dienelactone hydrolase family protein [Rhodospirillum sp.]MCF8490982.1 dienelactone hydrolase family protein [Rhodospirillum sp.]MCF8499499.1 dienelactone hydrolase family protein [Rhodospirillum sp.]